VNKRRFESRVLHLWVTTRVPLTRANLSVYSGAPLDRVVRWLDELVDSGVLELDSDDEGELFYRVRGAERPTSGPTHVGEIVKREQLEREVGGRSRALVRSGGAGEDPALARLERESRKLERRARQASALARRGGGGGGDRSVVASAALSFFLGPLGWLYAAPLRTAAAGIGGFLLLYWLLPAFLFTPLLGLLLPASAAAGAYFAWTRKPET
jgi:hypothetical protein